MLTTPNPRMNLTRHKTLNCDGKIDVPEEYCKVIWMISFSVLRLKRYMSSRIIVKLCVMWSGMPQGNLRNYHMGEKSSVHDGSTNSSRTDKVKP